MASSLQLLNHIMSFHTTSLLNNDLGWEASSPARLIDGNIRWNHGSYRDMTHKQ